MEGGKIIKIEDTWHKPNSNLRIIGCIGDVLFSQEKTNSEDLWGGKKCTHYLCPKCGKKVERGIVSTSGHSAECGVYLFDLEAIYEDDAEFEMVEHPKLEYGKPVTNCYDGTDNSIVDFDDISLNKLPNQKIKIMTVTERRVIIQDWYETDTTKTGWDSHGWVFNDTGQQIEGTGYEVTDHLRIDKFGNAFVGIAEKKTEVL